MVLVESLATQTLLLTMHYDDIDTRPLPGRFVTFYVDRKFLIILDVGNGDFHCSSSFLKATSLICEAQLSFAAHQGLYSQIILRLKVSPNSLI